jgi:hypothetical protein
MVSFFGKLRGEDQAKSRASESAPQRMDLEERQAFRREMLYQAIRESMISLEVNSSMYKFKIMNLDKRHHRFVVMIDVTKSFQPRLTGHARSLYDIEEFIKKHTFDRFGLAVEGIYWRVSDSESPFQREFREGDSPASTAAILESTMQTDNIASARSGGQRLARQPDELISDEEKRAFREAIRRGVSPPAIRVGDREYESEVAPLDDGKKRR